MIHEMICTLKSTGVEDLGDSNIEGDWGRVGNASTKF